MNKLIKKQGSNICFGVIAVVLAVMPLLYSAGLMNNSTVLFLGKCTAFAIAAMGIDLIWVFGNTFFYDFQVIFGSLLFFACLFDGYFTFLIFFPAD